MWYAWTDENLRNVTIRTRVQQHLHTNKYLDTPGNRLCLYTHNTECM